MNKKDYIPSHLREGFDDSMIEVLPEGYIPPRPRPMMKPRPERKPKRLKTQAAKDRIAEAAVQHALARRANEKQ